MEEIRDNGQAEVKQEISTIWQHGRERFIWSRAQGKVKTWAAGGRGSPAQEEVEVEEGKAHVNLSCLNKQEKATATQNIKSFNMKLQCGNVRERALHITPRMNLHSHAPL